LDELDPKEDNWLPLSVILGLERDLLYAHDLYVLLEVDGTESGIEVSKFLMDRDRAGFFWVNSQTYADLARHILEFLHDK
jgi:hypothetical protein